MLSIFDIFKIGVGPSSSHTVGPMLIARRFLAELQEQNLFEETDRIGIRLYGSLALTGIGHGTDCAVYMGLLGETPETIQHCCNNAEIEDIKEKKSLHLLRKKKIYFNPQQDLEFCGGEILPEHPNGIDLAAFDNQGKEIFGQRYFSIGGGFIRRVDEMDRDEPGAVPMAYPFHSGEELLKLCKTHDLAIHQIIARNEDALRPREQTFAKLDKIWQIMAACIERGLTTEGVLPGGLEVSRRAPMLWRKLTKGTPNEREALFDWLNVFAMAVNEENAAGGQVVTAPTNGAAGIIPAVIKFYCANDGVTEREKIRIFLCTAAGIGMLYKQRASISGAEMGCQGEVGVACSMAAAGLAAVWGGTPEQVEHAAEIGMEHNLGLTCDPVGGLVQIPCIERNAIGAVKAVNAARLALHACGPHKVSLDQVIETMRQTGLDMNSKYKETSEGGLAVNVVEC